MLLSEAVKGSTGDYFGAPLGLDEWQLYSTCRGIAGKEKRKEKAPFADVACQTVTQIDLAYIHRNLLVAWLRPVSQPELH